MSYQSAIQDQAKAGELPVRTRIEDLTEIGYELTDEELRLAVGGTLPIVLMPSAGTCTEPGACDDD